MNYFYSNNLKTNRTSDSVVSSQATVRIDMV